MADSLDDFFAKKDKKRGKDKSKTSALSAEALVRQLDEGAKQTDYPVRKDNKTAIEILGLDSNDEDWKDFEEVERRDYTGLKVKEMSLQDQNEEEQRRHVTEQVEPNTESTPWKSRDETVSAIASTTSPVDALDSAGPNRAKQQTNADEVSPNAAPNAADVPAETDDAAKPPTSDTSQQPVAAAAAAAAAAEATSPETDNSTKKDSDTNKPSSAKSAYVPPHLRGMESRSLAPVRMGTLRGPSSRPYNAPDFNDERNFPSLG